MISSKIAIQINELIPSINQVATTNGHDYIDAILTVCQKRGLDEQYVGELIAQHPVLKARIQSQAEQLHFLKQNNSKPIDFDIWNET